MKADKPGQVIFKVVTTYFDSDQFNPATTYTSEKETKVTIFCGKKYNEIEISSNTPTTQKVSLGIDDRFELPKFQST